MKEDIVYDLKTEEGRLDFLLDKYKNAVEMNRRNLDNKTPLGLMLLGDPTFRDSVASELKMYQKLYNKLFSIKCDKLHQSDPSKGRIIRGYGKKTHSVVTTLNNYYFSECGFSISTHGARNAEYAFGHISTTNKIPTCSKCLKKVKSREVSK